jgi:type II secretory pathway pseudopilin PulG
MQQRKIMQQRKSQHHKTENCGGFSLMELVIVVALSVMMVGIALSMFKQGTDVSTVVTERAQLQQDVRAAEDLMIRDFSLAGAGLPYGGVQLSNGGLSPRYGCDQTGVCWVPNGAGSGVNFPGRRLNYVMQGAGLGPALNAGQPNSDVVTVAYSDTTLNLPLYQVAFNATATLVTFTVPVPAPVPAPVAINNPVVGLVPGDLVLFQSKDALGNLVQVIGEVTGPVTVVNPTTYQVPFAAGDTLRLNQPGSTNDLDDLIGLPNPATAYRIQVISYYLSTFLNANGVAIPRLMRQVNGQPPVPVAENIVDFRVSYDTYDANGAVLVNVKDAGASTGLTPNFIRKINIQHLMAKKTLRGNLGNVTIDLQTEISARNMSFKDRYQ